MSKTKSIDSKNILEVIDTKLQTFRRKKELLEQKIHSESQEIEQIKDNIKELQQKLEITTENITKSTNEIKELDKVIEEVDLGYKNIIESGQTLMALVEINHE